MKTISPKILLTLSGAFGFNILFWQEKMGINSVIFDVFIISAVLSLYPGALARGSARWLLAGHLVSVAMVVIHNTMLSKIVATITIFLFAAFAEHIHRSVIFAAGSMAYQTGFLIAEFTELITRVKRQSNRKKWSFRKLRIVLFPLILLSIFFIVYIAANAAFASLTEKLAGIIENYFSNVILWISWDRILFILFGAYVTGSLIIKNRLPKLSDKELSMTDRLIRKKAGRTNSFAGVLNGLIDVFMGRFSKGILALKNKNLIGLISFVLLNLLLLIINVTDVVYIWSGNDYGKNESYTELLHEGTGILIFSIILAIVVVLFFFEGNLNFYRKNKWLKIAAFAWLIQNAFLVCSVFMRDYYYISHFGLAYKRIGVLFFLTMVLVGLASVFIKIYSKKSNYFLFRINGNVALFILVICSFVNWDVMIAEYNLARMDTIKPDVAFLMNMSDQTLPVIRSYKSKLTEVTKHRIYKYENSYPRERLSFSELLDRKENKFITKYAEHSWLSWNYADATVYHSLKPLSVAIK